jgi:hypothetical protein
VRHLHDHPTSLVLGHLPDLEGVADVVRDAEVRLERVALEDHRYVAIFGQYVVDLVVVDEDVSSRNLL